MTASDYIPAENWNLWYELFKASGNGRLQCQPFVGKDEVLVNYSFNDMSCCNDFHSEYYRLTTPIKEIKPKFNFWKWIKRHFKNSRVVV